MKLQKDNYSCGAFAILNVLKCFNRNVSLKEIRTHAATTKKHGTSQYGLLNAIERFGYTGKVVTNMECNDAIKIVSEYVESGSPVIMAINQWQHWIVVIGILGKNFIIFDSNNTKRNKAEYGVWVVTVRQLLKKCKGPDGSILGIAVSNHASSRY